MANKFPHDSDEAHDEAALKELADYYLRVSKEAYTVAVQYHHAAQKIRQYLVGGRSKEREIAELERWFTLGDVDGSERQANHFDPDTDGPPPLL